MLKIGTQEITVTQLIEQIIIILTLDLLFFNNLYVRVKATLKKLTMASQKTSTNLATFNHSCCVIDL